MCVGSCKSMKKSGHLMRRMHSSGLKVEKALKMLLQGLPKQFLKLSHYFKGILLQALL